MPTHPALASAQTPDIARLNTLLATLWQRNLPEIQARISVLDRAALAATNGALAPDVQHEAASVAHKLAGSLGMYGYAQASELARSIEQALDTATPSNTDLLRQHTIALRQAIQV